MSGSCGVTEALRTRPGAGPKSRDSGRDSDVQILRTLVIEPPDVHVARLAGEAIGLVQATVVGALVMAAASIRSDTVYTSDLGDLSRLLDVFPTVEIEPV